MAPLLVTTFLLSPSSLSNQDLLKYLNLKNPVLDNQFDLENKVFK